MKYLIALIFIVSPVFTQEPVYFRIFAEVKEDPVFARILQESKLEDVFINKFQMVVNTGGREPFVVIGDFNSKDVEWDEKAYRYDWLFFSPNVRNKLLLYKKKILLH